VCHFLRATNSSRNGLEDDRERKAKPKQAQTYDLHLQRIRVLATVQLNQLQKDRRKRVQCVRKILPQLVFLNRPRSRIRLTIFLYLVHACCYSNYPLDEDRMGRLPYARFHFIAYLSSSQVHSRGMGREVQAPCR